VCKLAIVVEPVIAAVAVALASWPAVASEPPKEVVVLTVPTAATNLIALLLCRGKLAKA
jgi:hypothetical protein